MFIEFWKVARWFILAAGLFITGAVAAAFTKYPFEKIGDLATWVAAFFAGAAFAGTIYIADSETRRRHQIEKQRAKLAAIRVNILAAETRKRIRDIEAQITLDMQSNNCAKSAPDYLNSLQLCPEFSEGDLLALLVLPDNCSMFLSSARQHLYSLTTVMKSFDSIRFDRNNTQNKFFNEIVSMLAGADAALVLGMTACDAAIGDPT